MPSCKSKSIQNKKLKTKITHNHANIVLPNISIYISFLSDGHIFSHSFSSLSGLLNWSRLPSESKLRVEVGWSAEEGGKQEGKRGQDGSCLTGTL